MFVPGAETATIDRLLTVAKLGVLLVVFAAVYNVVMAVTGMLSRLVEMSGQETPL